MKSNDIIRTAIVSIAAILLSALARAGDGALATDRSSSTGEEKLSDLSLGNFSTFVEAYAKTDLDGPHPGKTSVTLTPGLRCTIAHHHVVMLGVDLPLTHPRTFDETFRLTYIYSF